MGSQVSMWPGPPLSQIRITLLPWPAGVAAPWARSWSQPGRVKPPRPRTPAWRKLRLVRPSQSEAPEPTILNMRRSPPVGEPSEMIVILLSKEFECAPIIGDSSLISTLRAKLHSFARTIVRETVYLVPTLGVGMPSRTLRVHSEFALQTGHAERGRCRFHGGTGDRGRVVEISAECRKIGSHPGSSLELAVHFIHDGLEIAPRGLTRTLKSG